MLKVVFLYDMTLLTVIVVAVASTVKAVRIYRLLVGKLVLNLLHTFKRTYLVPALSRTRTYIPIYMRTNVHIWYLPCHVHVRTYPYSYSISVEASIELRIAAVCIDSTFNRSLVLYFLLILFCFITADVSLPHRDTHSASCSAYLYINQ